MTYDVVKAEEEGDEPVVVDTPLYHFNVKSEVVLHQEDVEPAIERIVTKMTEQIVDRR